MNPSKIEKLISDMLKEQQKDKDIEFINRLLADVDIVGLKEAYEEAIKQGCPADIASDYTAEAAAAMVFKSEAQGGISQAEFDLFRIFAKTIIS